MEEIFCVLIQPVARLRIDIFGRPGSTVRRGIQIAFRLEIGRWQIGRLHAGHWSGMGPRCHPFLSLHPVNLAAVEPIELVSGHQEKEQTLRNAHRLVNAVGFLARERWGRHRRGGFAEHFGIS